MSAGLASCALGLMVIVSWYAHWPRVLQIFPDGAPMQYNTALCFIFCGGGLFLLNTRFAGSVLWCGGATALGTSLTLLEYLAGRDFGIDQLLFRPYFEVATAFPGRMAPLTAICFIIFSAALCFASTGLQQLKRLATAGLLATIIGVIGLVAALGYLTGMKMAYGWGAYSLMAFHTAIAFMVLGGGMIGWCWQMAARQNYSFVQWVPIAASSTLLVMAAVISTATVSSLRAALDLRKHTYDVLLVAQSLLTSVTDVQRGTLGYVLSGKADSRAPYDRGSDTAPQQLAALTTITQDNPVQQLRLREIESDLSNVLSYNSKLIAAREQANLPVTDANDEGSRIIERVSASMNVFIQEEQRLLARRNALANVDFRNTARLLGLSTVLAALFLIGGALLIRREMMRRHQIELELLEVNDNIETLSGLLPICAHCKSIRDDKGYWNRIECYIQARSEATFSHGLCENCVRELYPAIADRVLSKMREENPTTG